MYAARYLLFGTSALSWAGVLLLLAGPDSTNAGMMGDMMGDMMTAMGGTGGKSEPALAPPYRFKIPLNEPWVLSQQFNTITMEPSSKIESEGSQSEGPSGNSTYRLDKIRMNYKVRGSRNRRRTDFSATFIFYNPKYTSRTALDHSDGIDQFIVSVDANGSENNTDFNEFANKMKNITKAFDSTPIDYQYINSWLRLPNNKEVSYKYSNTSYYDEERDNYFDCATTTKFSTTMNGNFFSMLQFDEVFNNKIKDYATGRRLTDNEGRQGKQLSDEKYGKGSQVTFLL